MKAIAFRRYGSADQLELVDVPRPVAKADELLIRVRASSINSWDWEFLNGTPYVNRLMFGLLKPRPSKRVLGADIAGTVEAIGERVTRFQPGDEVFGDLWDNWGGFAEYARANQDAMQPKPASLSFEAAASVPQAGVLALQGLRKGGELRAGSRVLVNGAGGGVGTFAVQLAKLAGAEVTGVDAGHKLDVARAAGADHVIDFLRQDFAKAGHAYDLIVDCQGTRSMLAIREVLRPAGVYAMVGGRMSRVWQLWLMSWCAPLFRDRKRLALVAEGPNKGLDQLGALLDSGQLTPFIDRTYPLHEAPIAMRRFGEGKHCGKIAITVGD